MKKVGVTIKRVEAVSKAKCNREDDKIQQFQNDCFAYIARIASIIYESEEKREHSIVEQAGRMQAAFSFVIAALLVFAQILVEKNTLPTAYLVISFSSVTFFLLLCLLFATFAQRRVKRSQWPSINDLENKVINEFKSFATEAQRSKYLLETYGAICDSHEKANNQRVLWLRTSMMMFYISLGLIVFWFNVGVLIWFMR